MQYSARSGFTLIELLVAITIVAILSTIGYSVFAGAQLKARDTVRRSDILAIANAIEGHFTGTYPPILNSWFAKGSVPTDPTSTRVYCIRSSDQKITYTTPAPSDVWTGGTSSPCMVTNFWYAVANNVMGAGTVSWQICALLESGNTPFCIPNRQ